MWVARDKKGNPVSKNDTLQLFLVKPTRCEEGYWHTDDWEYPESQDMYLPISWVKNFEYLTWDDEPVEVVIDNLDKLILKFEILNTQFQSSPESVGQKFEDFAKKNWNNVDLNYFDDIM